MVSRPCHSAYQSEGLQIIPATSARGKEKVNRLQNSSRSNKIVELFADITGLSLKLSHLRFRDCAHWLCKIMNCFQMYKTEALLMIDDRQKEEIL
jgi:hypothetical protein